MGNPASDHRHRDWFDARFVAVAPDQSVDHQLIADLAARLAASHPDGVDDTIADAMRQIAQALSVDRAILLRHEADAATPVTSHYWLKEAAAESVSQVEQLASSDFVSSKIRGGESVSFCRLDDVRDPVEREELRQLGVQSAAVVPIPAIGGSGAGKGALLMFTSSVDREWTAPFIDQLRLMSCVFGQALARKAEQEALRQALDELQRVRDSIERSQDRAGADDSAATRLRERSRSDAMYLRREADDWLRAGVIVGQSAAIQRVLEQARQVATTDSTVLLLGETGTGKELIATQIHELSARGRRSMVRVNCSAIPTTLMESELFGREKGAFTGALARQIGRFELADHSTIFLDEIGDLPMDVQVKLLRVLEERQVERLGSPRGVHVDVRIIAATHRNLEKRMTDGTFREDLFYRLNVFPIEVPPLRARPEDIPLLVWRFVDEFSKSFGRRIDAIPRENMAALQQYSWPGNIRELRNIVERAMITATGSQLTITLPTSSAPAAKRSVTMVDVETEHIRGVLESCGWRIRGSGGAAERLGLRPTTLETRMAKLGVTRPKRV
jgi:transcriptional regulator with GAF, ATPase, and Fis domain